MTRHFMAVRTTRWAAVLLGVASIGACSDAFVPDFNNPTIPGAISTQAELQGQASGLLAGDRDFHAFGILILETMGRDAYRIDVADPRYILQPLGQYSASAFIVDFLWNANYRTIRGAQELVRGIDNSGFSAQDKAATRGFARTFQALQYLRLIETRDSLGVPIALGSGVRDPVRCKPAVLDHIVALLDSAAGDLEAGGATFPFILPSGFSAFGTFDTPATFLEFNRALAAKALTYKGFASFASGGTVDAAALTAALAAIGESFAGTGTPLREGVYHTYSTRSGDATNFLYLGRGYNFPAALEGALKLKEISYIHAEGYPAAEMKHGPIALIDEMMPVVFIAPHDSVFDKITSNVQEVKARKGRVIAVTSRDEPALRGKIDYEFRIPETQDMLMPILASVPLQLMAYYVAVKRGANVDQPRNLAKSVTVE